MARVRRPSATAIACTHDMPFAPKIVEEASIVASSRTLQQLTNRWGLNRYHPLGNNMNRYVIEGDVAFLINIPNGRLRFRAIFPWTLNELPRGIVRQLGNFIGFIRAPHDDNGLDKLIDVTITGPVCTTNLSMDYFNFGDLLVLGEQPVDENGEPRVYNRKMPYGRIVACLELALSFSYASRDVDPILKVLDTVYEPMTASEQGLANLAPEIVAGLFMTSVEARFGRVPAEKVAVFMSRHNTVHFKLRAQYRRFYPSSVDIYGSAQRSGVIHLGGNYVRIDERSPQLAQNALFYWITLCHLITTRESMVLGHMAPIKIDLTPTQIKQVLDIAITNTAILPIYAIMLDIGAIPLDTQTGVFGSDQVLANQFLMDGVSVFGSANLDAIASNAEFNFFDLDAMCLSFRAAPGTNYIALPLVG